MAANHSNIQAELFSAIDAKDTNTIRSILSMNELSQSIINSGFRRAVDDLNKITLDVFLESDKVTPLLAYQLSLVFAVLNRDTEEVHRLIADPDIDPSEFDNISLQLAIAIGNVDKVRALLADPRIDPRVPEYKPFFTIVGASVNKLELLRIFLNDPRIDPTFNNNTMHNRIIEKLQNPKTSPQQKEEYEQMLELLRTGTRRLRVATMMKAGGGKAFTKGQKDEKEARNTGGSPMNCSAIEKFFQKHYVNLIREAWTVS